MRLQVVPDLAESVGLLWRELQEQYTSRDGFTVAAPLSSTPLPIYRWVVDNATTFSCWGDVKFVLMDEQLDGTAVLFRYVSLQDPASYEGFARRHFLDPLHAVTKETIPVVKPQPEAIASFDVKIHLLVLAVGVDGNYANVMPGTAADVGWHVAQLTPAFQQVHTNQGSQSYAGASFREYGMSLGPQQVMDADHVAVIASGARKRSLVKKLVSLTSFTPDFSLSIIYDPVVRNKVTIAERSGFPNIRLIKPDVVRVRLTYFIYGPGKPPSA